MDSNSGNHPKVKTGVWARLLEYGWQPVLFGAVTVALGLVVVALLDFSYRNEFVQRERAEVLEGLKSRRTQLQTVLESQARVGTSISDMISTELVGTRGLDEKRLADFTLRQIAREDPELLVVVRDETGRLFWFWDGDSHGSAPAERSELVSELVQKVLSDRTPASRLLGPYEGGDDVLMMSLDPIYRESGDRITTLWGNVFVGISLNKIVARSGLLADPEMASTLSIQTAGRDPDLSVIGKVSHPFENPVLLRATILGSTWHFRTEPISGWRSRFHELWLLRTVGILSALLLGAIVHMVKRNPKRLEAKIEEATAALRSSERKFRLSEERLNGILQSLDQVVWSGDPVHSKMLYLSPIAEQLYGIPVQRFFDDPGLWSRVIHPEDIEKVSRYTDILQREGVVSMEYRIVRPNGEIRWVRDRGNVVYDANGKAIRLDGILSDITEQVKARHELLLSQQRIKNIVQGAPIILYAVDTAGIFTLAEGRGLEALGQVAGEVVGLSYEEVYPNEEEPKQDWARAIAGDTFLTIREIRGYIFETWYSPIVDEHDEILGAVAVATDITARQLAEEALRESEDRFRRLATASTEGVALSIDGIIHDANETFARMLGQSLVHLIGTSPLDYVETEYHEVVSQKLEDHDETPFEAVFMRKDGSRFPAEVVGRSILYDGKLAHVASVRDITIQVEAKEQLLRSKEAAEAAVRAKGEFLANMSHEIRTPLNGVLGIAELLDGTKLDAQQREYVRVIRTSGEGLLQIINDILDFSKIEAGRLELENTAFDIIDGTEAVVDLLAQKGLAKGLEIIFDVDPAMPRTVIGDPVRIRQVITNLLNNAIKFTEKGEVTVAIQLVEKRGRLGVFRFSINDTGIGIPPDRLDRLFRPFSQIDSSTTRRFGGTGLGLVISQQLVQAMGGTIKAISSSGQGSSFSFRLELPLGADDRTPVPQIMLYGVEVAVAEPSANLRSVIQKHFQSWGARVSEVGNAEEMWTLLDATPPPSLLLMDQKLLRGERRLGVEAVANAAASGETSIVIMVSRPNSKELQALRDRPNIYTIRKPLKFEPLGDLLRRILTGDVESLESGFPDASPTPTGVEAPSADTHSILVVEDNPVNQLVVVEMLRRMGFHCDSADNGLEAIRAIEAIRYDLVLMDCQMPEMDGYEATRQLREKEHGSGRHLPIVAITANAMKGDREKCLNAGMDDYISKPVTVASLKSILEKYLPIGTNSPTATPAPANETQNTELQVLDRTRLQLISGEDPALADEFTTLFVNDVSMRASHIVKAIQDGDLELVRQNAHTIKGASGNLGAEKLHQAAEKLERYARDGEGGRTREQIQNLLDEFGRVCDALGRSDMSISL